MRYKQYLYALSMLILLWPLPPAVPAQEPTPKQNVDIGSFVKEIMIVRIEGKKQVLALWFPVEFFLATAIESDPRQTRASAEREMGFLKPYVTIAVQVNRELPDSTEVYQTEKEVRARAVLKLDNGTEVRPLETMPQMMTAALGAMKAIMSSQGGEDRANTHFLIFPNQTSSGKPLIDENKKDKLTLVLKADSNFREMSFVWRTPFDAVTSIPDCPRCKAGVSAKWTYCPFCGQKLP